MQQLLARTLGVASIVAAVCVGASGLATAGGGDHGGYPPGHPTTTDYEHPTTSDHEYPTTPTTPKPTYPHETTTTYPQHETTTTMKHHNTTSTSTSISSTTTSVGGVTTTTTIKTTTTTTGGVTTTTKETTTTVNGSTTTSRETTTTGGGGGSSTTSPPRPSLFGVNVSSVCADGAPAISITFGNRPDLNGHVGELQMIALPSGLTVGNRLLPFASGQTVTIPYPTVPANTTSLTLNYGLDGEFATATVGPPLTNCAETTTTGGTSSSTTTTTSSGPTTSATAPPSNSTTPSTLPTSSSSTVAGPTTSSATTSTTLPPTFDFGGAATVCISEVPTIEIVFQNLFPQLAGRVGTLTMSDINGNVVSTQPLTYQPGATVHILYPGTSVNPDGSIADVPGWILTSDGFWIRDPSDEFLREGINLTYTVNPTATAFITYPPESSTCANPKGPFAPGETPPTTVAGALPVTGSNWVQTVSIATLLFGLGWFLIRASRRKV